MKYEKIEPGMVLLDIHSERCGNTTMRELGLWRVAIISVDREKHSALVSWNGNPPKTWYKRELERLKAKPTAAYLRQVERKRKLAVNR